MRISTLGDLALTNNQILRYLETISSWERAAYGEGKFRKPDELFACVAKNAHGFIVAIENETLVGYSDLWVLTEPFYSRLREGLEMEESLAPSSIAANGSGEMGLNLYVGSVVICSRFRVERPTLASLAFAAICNHLSTLLQARKAYPTKLLGVGSSKFGQKLLIKWNFQPVDRHQDAIDRRPRFEKTLLAAEDTKCFELTAHRKKLVRTV